MEPRATWPEPGGPLPMDGAGFAQELAGLASSLQREAVDQAGLDTIADAAVKIVPGADGAAVLAAARPGQIEVRAAHGALPQAVADLQNEVGQGPCLDAVLQTGPVLVRDTAADGRWPLFSPRAAALGAASIMCTPMTDDTVIYGFLIVISQTAGGLGQECARLASALAAHAGIALAGARARRQLGTALSSRDVIGQAKGILMERYRVTADGAFAVLARVSQDTNTKLRDVAGELCQTGTLPLAGYGRQLAATS